MYIVAYDCQNWKDIVIERNNILIVRPDKGSRAVILDRDIYDQKFHMMQETIQIVVEHFFQNNPQLAVTKRELKQFFNFATSGTHFIFNGSFYDQLST